MDSAIQNNISSDDIKMFIKSKDEINKFNPLVRASSVPVLNKNDCISSTTDTAVQINMDCDPGEDPKKNKRYWEHLAGLRGAEIEYLKSDIRDFKGKVEHQKFELKLMDLRMCAVMAELEELRLRYRKCICRNPFRRAAAAISSRRL